VIDRVLLPLSATVTALARSSPSGKLRVELVGLFWAIGPMALRCASLSGNSCEPHNVSPGIWQPAPGRLLPTRRANHPAADRQTLARHLSMATRRTRPRSQPERFGATRRLNTGRAVWRSLARLRQQPHDLFVWDRVPRAPPWLGPQLVLVWLEPGIGQEHPAGVIEGRPWLPHN
jgi:hypothetical protein